MYSSGERRRRFSDGGEAEKIKRSTDKKHLFDDAACRVIERKIDEVCKIARDGGYKKCTVDQTKLRDKYFFGAGYIYGAQMKTVSRGPGNEKLYPEGAVDEVPQWIFDLVVRPIEESGMIPKGFINNAVINDYRPGGFITSHIDPPQLFQR